MELDHYCPNENGGYISPDDWYTRRPFRTLVRPQSEPLENPSGGYASSKTFIANGSKIEDLQSYEVEVEGPTREEAEQWVVDICKQVKEDKLWRQRWEENEVERKRLAQLREEQRQQFYLQIQRKTAERKEENIQKAIAARCERNKNAYESRLKQSEKANINLVVVGHVDAGKSTLMGHVLFQLGYVQNKVMHKYEQVSKSQGKASFAYAWVLDATSEERSRGVTMDIAQREFQTENRHITLSDAPGHRDFVPNMIKGASQADVALLVVDAGQFEKGFEEGGQTQEHILLVRSVGVSKLIVAVSKMDKVHFSQQRFEEIRKKLGAFLIQIAGFRKKYIQFIPCSGLTGENLTKPSTVEALTKWYSGPCLTKLIDKLQPPQRPFDRPYRQCIMDTNTQKLQNCVRVGGIRASGVIQAGSISCGDQIKIMPGGETATVKHILLDDEFVSYAFAGDNATVVLTDVDEVYVTPGSILCDPFRPINLTYKLQAKIVVFDIKIPIIKGRPVEFHYQSMSEPAVIKTLVVDIDNSTGEVIKKKPRVLARNSTAIVEIHLEHPICMEKESKDYRRFMLRSRGATIAAGVITEVLQQEQF